MVLPKKKPKEIYSRDQEIIRAGAPGRVFLHGEQTVQYGKKGIAVSVGMYTRTKMEPLRNDTVVFKVPNIKLELTIPMEKIHKLREKLGKGYCYSALAEFNEIPLTPEQRETIQEFVCKLDLKPEEPGDAHKHFKVTEAFLGLYCAMWDDVVESFDVTVDSELPVCQGMGFSAGFGTTLAAAILFFHELIPRGHKLAKRHRRLVFKWGLLLEKFVHENTTGMETQLTTFGGAAEFQRDENGVETYKEIKFPDIEFFVIYPGFERSIFDVMMETNEIRQKSSESYQGLVDKIGEITDKQLEQLRTEGAIRGDYIHKTHYLLKDLGASCEEIDKIVKICEEHGFAAKVMGKGGSCVSAYIPSEIYESETIKVNKLTHTLMKSDYGYVDTRFGTSGFDVG